ncbi:hypothetical protein [Yersinia intermedia]|uniref:hypothetical protein n=1 Tax=Yersinia intermedia TaxID=631 RepID=UPI001CFD55A7|nr:hypothetical protein [Yersinia intermedia]MCB5313307.1 hypothetical protein [Yersinia intermedia]
MFSGEAGLLISDNMKFASILCNEVAPKEVVTAIVKYTIDADSQRFTDSLDEDVLSEIIQEQNKLGEKEIDLCDIYGGDVNEELKERFSVVLNRNIDNSYKNW